MIAAAGGIDIQLLGIGRTGHVGFNEPGSSRASRTRLITLDRVTRKDAASDFFGEEHVPLRALTMGIATILEARRIVLLAFGEGKADVVSRLVEGPVTDAVPATFLQEHPCAEVHLDQAAAGALTRRRSPWVTGPVAWDPRMVRKAVAWLAATVRKPVLKLTNEDYNEHHLQDLLAIHGRAHQLNLQVFRDLQETITGWPGGKPAVHKQPGDIDRPRDRVFPKRVLVFSPHPDDDVISMGGTLIRLVDQGHEVHVAYQTSGTIAVFDGDALRFLDSRASAPSASRWRSRSGCAPSGPARSMRPRSRSSRPSSAGARRRRRARSAASPRNARTSWTCPSTRRAASASARSARRTCG
jgi:glucosamine-6-phosphate deaminase